MSLWQDIEHDVGLLGSAVEDMSKQVGKAARADFDFRRIKAKAMIKERANGTPATIIKDIIYIRNDVNDAKLESDLQTGLLDADKEQINALKLQIRIGNDQLQREWTQAGNRRD